MTGESIVRPIDVYGEQEVSLSVTTVTRRKGNNASVSSNVPTAYFIGTVKNRAHPCPTQYQDWNVVAGSPSRTTSSHERVSTLDSSPECIRQLPTCPCLTAASPRGPTSSTIGRWRVASGKHGPSRAPTVNDPAEPSAPESPTLFSTELGATRNVSAITRFSMRRAAITTIRCRRNTRCTPRRHPRRASSSFLAGLGQTDPNCTGPPRRVPCRTSQRSRRRTPTSHASTHAPLALIGRRAPTPHSRGMLGPAFDRRG